MDEIRAGDFVGNFLRKVDLHEEMLLSYFLECLFSVDFSKQIEIAESWLDAPFQSKT